MANTYTKLYVHVVFAVKGRDNLISTQWKDDLYRYITGIVSAKDQKLMIINGMADHIHILLGLRPDCRLSDLIRDIKANSSRWINEKRYVVGKFEWQTGFGAFTLGQSQVKRVADYIQSQEEHHHGKSFKEEYIAFLKAYQIDFKTEYIFDDFSGC